jgi:hypothetical protein
MIDCCTSLRNRLKCHLLQLVLPAAEILENYGIDCETDLSVLDQDDFSKLASRGLKPLHVKKLERWCETVCERAENMLPKTPAAAALLSSEALNVVTPAAHSVVAEESECESGAENESERDGEEDNDDSDDDLQIVGEQSGTADSTGASSAGTEAPAKKAKITLTLLGRAREICEAVHPCCVQSRQNAQNKRATRVRQGFLHQKARSKTA